jgi:hypothetical protein
MADSSESSQSPALMETDDIHAVSGNMIFLQRTTHVLHYLIDVEHCQDTGEVPLNPDGSAPISITLWMALENLLQCKISFSSKE